MPHALKPIPFWPSGKVCLPILHGCGELAGSAGGIYAFVTQSVVGEFWDGVLTTQPETCADARLLKLPVAAVSPTRHRLSRRQIADCAPLHAPLTLVCEGPMKMGRVRRGHMHLKLDIFID